MFSRRAWVAVLAAIGVSCASAPPKDVTASDAGATAGETQTAAEAVAEFAEFPAEAIRALAGEIERQVADGNREPTLTGLEGLIVDTPELRQAVRTRAARIELVNTMLDAGHSWERRNGRIWILRTQEYKASTSRRQRDIDAIMINGENRDRWTIYEGIVEKNRLGRGALSKVEEIFFEARTQHMTAGQKYESSNGEQSLIAATQ